MEWSSILWSGLLSFCIAIMMFQLNRLYNLIDNIQQEVKDIHRDYTRRDDFIRFMEHIDASLKRIEEKLDSKQDK